MRRRFGSSGSGHILRLDSLGDASREAKGKPPVPSEKRQSGNHSNLFPQSICSRWMSPFRFCFLNWGQVVFGAEEEEEEEDAPMEPDEEEDEQEIKETAHFSGSTPP